MKKAILIVCMIVTSGTFAFAENGENLLDHVMHRKICYPESLRAKGIETTVNIRLRVISENKVEVVEITSDSEEMKAAIQKQVEQMKLRIPLSMVGGVYSYSLHFQVQK